MAALTSSSFGTTRNHPYEDGEDGLQTLQTHDSKERGVSVPRFDPLSREKGGGTENLVRRVMFGTGGKDGILSHDC